MLVKSCQKPVEINPVTNVYRAGVYINGIDVSGKTTDEARALLMPGIDYTLANVAVTLQTDSFTEMITGPQMDATSDVEAVLTEALAGGANKSYYTKVLYDTEALDSRIAEINENLSFGPTEPTFTVELSSSGKPEFNYVPGTAGMGLDVAATEKLVVDALENGQLQPVLTPHLTQVQPTVTVEDLQKNTALRGAFYTSYRNKAAEGTAEQKQIVANRAFNVAKGAELLNNVVVKPGKWWSFNDTVGDRNERNGWKEANGISFGNQYTLQYGGGICQVSTTLYGALLRAGIAYDDISRREHSIPSDYVDYGLDATVDTDHIDLKFKNTTGENLYIFCYITQSSRGSRWSDINVRIYGAALPEGTSYEPRSVTIETIPPGEVKIIYDKKQTVEYDELLVTAREGYVVEVYLDTVVNGQKTSKLLYRDKYEAIAEQRRQGTLPTPTPEPSPTPDVPLTPEPAPESGSNAEDAP